MNKSAPDNKPDLPSKSLEEIISGISDADSSPAQSVIDRMVSDARQQGLAEAEARHKEAMAKALAEAEARHGEALSAIEQRHAESMGKALSAAEERHREAMDEALAAAEARHKRELQALYEKLALQRQRMYGRKSERHTHEPPVFDEAEATAQDSTEADDQAFIPPADESDKKASAPAGEDKKSAKPRGKRSPIPPHVRRFDVFLTLPEDQRICPCCNEPMAEIGEQTSEQIDIIPMQFLVTCFHRIRYACGHREHKPLIAPRPPQVLPKSNASNALLAMLMTMKYADGLPLNRIEDIFARYGLKVPRVTQARWMIQSAEKLKPLVEAMHQVQLSSDLILMDETTVQVLKEKGRDPSTKSFMWVQQGGPKGKTVVRYTYDPSRSGDVPVELLKGWKGHLMTDGYAGYNEIGRQAGVTLMACWVHARRKFKDVVKLYPKLKEGRAHEMLAMISELYKIEKTYRKASEEDRYQVRQTQSKPILDRIKAWLDAQVDCVPPKGALGEAIAYTLKLWPRLILFVERGDLPIDNNGVENAIRPFVLGRRAWLFCDTPAGAHASALIYSLIETARANNLEPYSWLHHVMRELPKAREMGVYDHLLPWNLSAADLIREAYAAEAPIS